MQNCKQCDSTGVLLATQIATGNRYAFICNCISGERRNEAYEKWGNPTRGFTLSIVEGNPSAAANKNESSSRGNFLKLVANGPDEGELPI